MKPRFFRGNEPPFVRASHALLKDAAGFGIDFDLGLIANKRIHALRLTHTSNVSLGDAAYFPTTTMENESGTI
jgi:hypothetical protein